MTLNAAYSLSVAWLSVIALLCAIDLGIAAGHLSTFAGNFPTNLLSVTQVLLYAAVLFGLRNKFAWGWILAIVWVPIWIAYSSFELYDERDLVLSLLWTPFFFCSALAHRVLLNDGIRSAFGVRAWLWSHLTWVPVVTFGVTLFVPLSILFGSRIAAALCLTLLLAMVTAPRVYGKRIDSDSHM